MSVGLLSVVFLLFFFVYVFFLFFFFVCFYFVRRAASTIALKVYSSYIPGPIDSILGRKHQGDL